ncbi:hypothetical protein NLM27_42285 [Bradyrhizobium sp. CCGB12]|uniref:hypothetical protein n=1 Tax=Bradyrhizobium sp. CCGB12 TaxID=2949632 RepID=UPI0020B3B36A|nr:hypothetical protein [Bradyrhizobium sp. CCGB12]MCP3395357.1 hypothetical protein [Bradyrhizobium sp. CCGB12]
MTPMKISVFRPNSLSERKAIEEARRVIAESTRVLEIHPLPETFLGRQTHRPIPLLGDQEN